MSGVYNKQHMQYGKSQEIHVRALGPEKTKGIKNKLGKWQQLQNWTMLAYSGLEKTPIRSLGLNFRKMVQRCTKATIKNIKKLEIVSVLIFVESPSLLPVHYARSLL